MQFQVECDEGEKRKSIRGENNCDDFVSVIVLSLLITIQIQDCEFYITPSVYPSPEAVKNLIEMAGTVDIKKYTKEIYEEGYKEFKKLVEMAGTLWIFITVQMRKYNIKSIVIVENKPILYANLIPISNNSSPGGIVHADPPSPAKIIECLETDKPYIMIATECDMYILKYLTDAGCSESILLRVTVDK